MRSQKEEDTRIRLNRLLLEQLYPDAVFKRKVIITKIRACDELSFEKPRRIVINYLLERLRYSFKDGENFLRSLRKMLVELINNANEHGCTFGQNPDQSWISITLVIDSFDTISIKVEDQGDGCLWTTMLDNYHEHKPNHGLLRVKKIAEPNWQRNPGTISRNQS